MLKVSIKTSLATRWLKPFLYPASMTIKPFMLVGFILAISLQASATPLVAALKAPQQQLYQQTLTAIKKGHKTRTRQGMQALATHPLYPYLQKAELERKLHKLPFQLIDQFLLEQESSVAARQLRKKWLKVLAAKNQWPQFLHYYDKKTSNNELRCSRLEALHQTGLGSIALEQTASIWLNGKSLPSSCDPVFKRWQQAGYKTDALVWQRTKLALDKRNSLLARYLSKRASAELKPYTRRLISVYRNPKRLSKQLDFAKHNIYTTDIIYHGLKWLAPRDYQLATKLWIDYRGRVAFSEQQYSSIRNKIARQIIASGQDNALSWLIAHDPNVEDSYLMEWRIRLSLKQQQWSQAENWIYLLPLDLQQKPRWRYWLARSWQLQNKKPESSLLALQQLATERHYYGFLAADKTQYHYGFNHSELSAGPLISTVEKMDGIIRSQYFYIMGDMVAARREWNMVIKQFQQPQLLAATRIAHQWGWHQQAINTTIKANHWNDLSIRFPLAFQNNILDSAKSATIQPEWLYAITRQESAFAIDAYSSAGASGLMQLRPGTAQLIAKKMGVSYNKKDLFSAEKNISLGSNYLKQLLNDFSGNRILATAAYNAGPHRVKRWLNRQTASLPYDIWIETLPFHETRNYVQNVLAFSVIYGRQLGINSSLIGKQEQLIGR